MVTIITFIIFYTIYTIELFIKYISPKFASEFRTVVEGYFIVNIFFMLLMIPVISFHDKTKSLPVFLNMDNFANILKIFFCIVSIIFLLSMYYLKLPFDVMGSCLIWLFLLFSILSNKNKRESQKEK